MTDTTLEINDLIRVLASAQEQIEEAMKVEEAYKARIKQLQDSYEELRPHWAKGYTSDSRAAQVNLAATLELWELLGVTNQTAAVSKLEGLMADYREANPEAT